MKQSQLFTKTRREAPADEVSKNARALIRAGFVHKEMAGVYDYLPLGLRVVKKIENIIREEMNAIGGQEIFLSVLQDPEPWQASGRWDDKVVDIWFKTKLASGQELGLGNTHEEPLTKLMKQHIASYKDLPQFVYQIQTKFRNELRAKSGLMRGREFTMKDLYSFTTTTQELDEFYQQCAQAYMNIFDRVGIGSQTYRTFASGGSFSKFSDEFQTLAEAGEDTIYVDEDTKIAVNKEVFTDEILADLKLNKNQLIEKKAIEVGNIFKLGTKYSEAIGLNFTDEQGVKKPVVMGSYGIGVGRLMGTVVEVLSDDKGIVWPESIAPFKVHLLLVNSKQVTGDSKVEEIYHSLQKFGIEVLCDDRDVSAGQKFADSDLIGIPYRVVVSPKTLEIDSVEIKKRDSDKVEMVNVNQLSSFLAS